MNKLVDYLLRYENKSEDFTEIFNSNQLEFDASRVDIEDINKQLSIETATWGLDIYEKELNIPTDLSKPISERREVITSKWRGTGKVDRPLIKNVVDAYTNGQVEVGFDGNIIITFTGVVGTPPNIQDAMDSVSNIAPAHLQIIYRYLYLLVKDVHNIMTLNQIESIKMDKFAF